MLHNPVSRLMNHFIIQKLNLVLQQQDCLHLLGANVSHVFFFKLRAYTSIKKKALNLTPDCETEKYPKYDPENKSV